MDPEKRFVVAKVEVGAGKAWEFGISRGELVYTGRMNNQVLPYKHRELYSISCDQPE